MKKEIFSALLLLLLFAAALVNMWYIERLTEDMAQSVDISVSCAAADSWDSAEKHVRSAISQWENSDSYTHIVLRHSEIDLVSDSLFSLLERVCARDMGGVTGAAESAHYHLDSISGMEQIKLGSIF